MTGLSPLVFSGGSYLPFAAALAGAAISAYTDLKTGRIKNTVTFPMIAFGWGWSFALGGWQGFGANALVSCAVGAVSTLAGKMGPGDVKLILGIAACLEPPLSLFFGAFLFMALAVSAVFVRLKAHNFRLKAALAAMRAEALMEVAGVKDAGAAVHGEKVRHPGGPVIFAALVLCLAWTWFKGVPSI